MPLEIYLIWKHGDGNQRFILSYDKDKRECDIESKSKHQNGKALE